jgi:hypothetical protein
MGEEVAAPSYGLDWLDEAPPVEAEQGGGLEQRFVLGRKEGAVGGGPRPAAMSCTLAPSVWAAEM